jgi:hypothetical protein
MSSCLDGWAGSDFLREMTLTCEGLDGVRPATRRRSG